MNILASYAWLKEYVHTDCSPEQFAQEFSLRSMSVETVTQLRERFAHMIVGTVVSCTRHPNADRLQVVLVDCGNDVRNIVCGGENVRPEMRVVVAEVGARVRWHGGAEWTEIVPTTIRGVESAGMICAPAEIGFDGVKVGARDIWDITAHTNAPNGTSIVDALLLDDALFDCEITTNRPDAMGIVGLAREAACALQTTFHDASIPNPLPNIHSDAYSFDVQDARCSRYMAAVVSGIRIQESPWWLQRRLLLAGHTPINTIVDITNYVMLELGQPLHAFDADRVSGGSVVVRAAKDGEQLALLDGRTVTMNPELLVVADEKASLALAGIMGGKDSGVSSETQTVIFEAATFEKTAIRKGARTLDLATDAQALFEKGLAPGALPRALARAVELALMIAGGVCEHVYDSQQTPLSQKTFLVSPKKVSARIGIEIDEREQQTILETLGFTVLKKNEVFQISVPYWRENDIEDEVDFTEEIARMYGYHKLPALLPASRIPNGTDDSSLMWEFWTKRFLAESGFTECFSNSLVSVSDLEMYAKTPHDALRVLNPLTADLTHLRTTLVPSLLRTIERNQAHTPSAKIFEVGRVYIPKQGALPEERLSFVFGTYGVVNAEQSFMEIRGVLDAFCARTGIVFTYERMTESTHWHAGRSVGVFFDGVRVGVLGQVVHEFQQAFGIHRPVFFAAIDLEVVLPKLQLSYQYRAPSVFPSSARDISFVLDERVPFQKVHDIICGASSLVRACDFVDVYRGNGVPEGKKSVTFSITCSASDRTLTSEEVDEVFSAIIREVSLRADGVIRE